MLPIRLDQHGGRLICQKDSFLAGARGVALGIAFQRNIMTGLFGGEGFIMQKLEGDGLAFMHAGGTIIKKDLVRGETLKLDTGCLVAMTQTVNYDVQFAKDLKSASPKEPQRENPKFAMRTWLLRMGFIGEEFTTARDILTKNLEGDAAFRFGRSIPTA